jgi:membrane-bound lytic murein transglycosylase A
MVAQDTGSAITGPARADIYFGAGAGAGRVSGRLRNNVRFVILVPKSLDPAVRGHKMPVPDARPSEKIAKLFPQADSLKDQQKDTREEAKSAGASSTPTDVAKPIPLPEARPIIKSSGEPPRHRRYHRYRRR